MNKHLSWSELGFVKLTTGESKSKYIFCIQWFTTALEALASHVPTAQDLGLEGRNTDFSQFNGLVVNKALKMGTGGDLFHNTDPLILRMCQSPSFGVEYDFLHTHYGFQCLLNV